MGDWWTPLILRECFFGRRRFEEFREALGLSRAVLAQRLERLVEEGLLERQPYQDRPPRDEYRLTDKGTAFFDVLAAMWRFGSDWMWERGGPAVQLVDPETGARVVPAVIDEATGEAIDPARLSLRFVRT